MDLANALAYESGRRGCSCIVTERSEKIWLWSVIKGRAFSLRAPSQQHKALLRATDLYIFMLGPQKPIDWERIPDSRKKDVTLWFLEDNSFVRMWKEISKNEMVRMVGIEATIATPNRSKILGLEYNSWRKVMFQGCLADYHEVSRVGRRLQRLLARHGRVKIVSAGGTDLTVELCGRTPILNDGLATRRKAEEGRVVFLPAGDLEVAIKETSAKGTVVYDAPMRTRQGIVRGLKVTVDRGRVISFDAVSGAEVFESYLNDTEGGSGVLSFIGFGLNPKLKFGFTQDDKVMGGLTVGFGDNSSKGGMNRAGRDWWGSVTQSTVDIEGVRVIDKGKVL